MFVTINSFIPAQGNYVCVDDVNLIKNIFLDAIKEDVFLRDDFDEYGFLKLSRRKFAQLKNSYVIRCVNQKMDENNKPVFSNDINDYNLKIYSVVHGGDKGFIGEGSFKIVKYVKDIVTGQKYVKSKFKQLDVQQIQLYFPGMLSALNESKGLSQVSGGHLAVLESYDKGTEFAYIMNDFAETDLKKAIKQKLPEQLKNKFALELLTGLAAMHKAGVVHRDIKPENVNIINNSAYLADLDHATTEYEPGNNFGSPCFNPPEVISDCVDDIEGLKCSDVYQLGITLYELFNEKHPWYDEKYYAESLIFYNKLPDMTGDKYAKKFPEPAADTIDHLIWEMIHVEPYRRPTAEQAYDRLKMLVKDPLI